MTIVLDTIASSLVIIDSKDAITYINPQFKEDFKFALQDSESVEEEAFHKKRRGYCSFFSCCTRKK